jgi:phosphatidyl-myo-inositol dimannoside synthase
VRLCAPLPSSTTKALTTTARPCGPSFALARGSTRGVGAMVAELRALVVTPDFPPAVGGIQTVMSEVLCHAEGVAPRVVTLRHDGAGSFDAGLDFTVRRTTGAPFGYRVGIARLNAAAVLEALRFRPQVILSGHVVTAPAAVLIRRLLGVPVVQYLYGYELAARPRLTSFAVRHANVNIAISRYTKELAVGAGAAADRVHVIPVGASVEDVGATSENHSPTLLTVGRLSERYKGHDVVLRALPLVVAGVPDARWVVVGDGPLRAELEARAAAFGVRDRVHFTGQVPDAERDGWFRQAQVFVMPARAPVAGAGEGFGIVFLEANLHGLPVVAGGVGGALDAVVDGVTGVLVDPTDHVAVADAVVDLLRDPEKARSMGASGAARARQDFGWPEVAARVEAVLRSVVRATR